MNDDDISKRALDAWPASEPPPGFADRVMAARAVSHGSRGRRRIRLAIAVGVAIVALAAGLLAQALRPTSGQRTLTGRETITLGRRGLAVAEAGTQLSWTVSAGGDARVEQTSGNVFYRVESGGPFVVAAPDTDVTVTGTCFRVEVQSVATVKENARAALAGAAAASVVLVTVYEGRVRIQQHEGAQKQVELAAGEQARFQPLSPSSGAQPWPPSQAASRTLAPPTGALATKASAPAPKTTPLEGASPAVLRARISELEAQVAQLSAAQADVEMFSKVRGFTPDELKRFAENCELRMGAPAYGSTPPKFNPEEARKLSVPASEVEQVNQILAAQNVEFNRAMRDIYLAGTGDVAGADQLDSVAMVHELLAKTSEEQKTSGRRTVARENAGLAKPPADSTSEPAITRMFRLQNGVSAKLEEALAASLGHADAERMIDALTPMHTAYAGCPQDKP
ncbi:MAG: hypothetical protein JST92_22510 [Deltaproteobacteria bacterium]|nr:hypothetical protein [Deltaproteobacteria bacterium]